MPKNKSHKGILKRVKLTKSGKIRHKKAFTGHIKSTKSGKRLRQLRMDKYMSSAEAKRLEKLLHRRLRGRDQPEASIRRSPSPEQKRAKRAAAAEAAAK
jgi:large subunit ribosomal protein L35